MAEEDPSAPGSVRFVIEALRLDGATHRVDPADVVMAEFRQAPIEIVRMLAAAELTLRLSPRIDRAAACTRAETPRPDPYADGSVRRFDLK